MAKRRRSFETIESALAANPTDVRVLRVWGSEGGKPPLLPPALFNCTELEELYLSYVGLRAIQPEIGQLTRLKRLGLSGNELTTLPPEIGQLKRLNELDLAKNPMTDLPPELFALRANMVTYPDSLKPDVFALSETLVAATGGPPASPGAAPSSMDVPSDVWISMHLGVAPAPEVSTFASSTRGLGRIAGPFSLSGFDAARGTRRTFAEFWGFNDYGDAPFPAVLIGGDERGHEFWLSVADGAVLALHHDELFEFAYDTRQMLVRTGRDSPSELMKELVYSGSLIDLRTLLYLQAELPRAGITDWSAFLRGRPTPAQRDAVCRLICIGRQMSPGHLHGSLRWRREASRWLRPVLTA